MGPAVGMAAVGMAAVGTAAVGMAAVGMAVGWMGVGCGRTEQPAHRYAELAGRADPDGCDTITEPSLRAECRAFAAWELARRGEEARAEATCAGLAGGAWRDECFFQLADIVAATGERGRALCARAGRYEGHCVGHGLGRESQAILERSPIGDEDAAFEAVVEVAAAWVGPRRARSRAGGILRQSLAARFPAGTDFDVERCGSAPAPLCRDAYIQLVVERSGIDGGIEGGAAGAPLAGAIGTICAGSRTSEAVEALGLPGWTPASDAIVAAAWQRICAGGLVGPLAPGQARPSPPRPPAPGTGGPPP